MSQNKTVFPGLGQESDFNPNQGYSGNTQPYSRSSQARGNGTVYPGMEGQSSRTSVYPQQNLSSFNAKPIVGFLYSISRNGIGEYWPLHIGQNIIGTSHECDIMLREGTVSQKHANLHINKMKKPEKTEATIIDLGSTNGTQVNENSVSVARPVECVNGDIITIGENYDFLLLLIDTKAMGLHVSENFIDLGYCPEDLAIIDSSSTRNDATRNEQDFPPRFIGPDTSCDGGSRPNDSTVGLDSNDGFRRGGTVGMD